MFSFQITAIKEAVNLMKLKTDLNRHYRAELQAGENDAVSDTSRVENILRITMPILFCILVCILVVMCCTRANSPICKIFEPQA